jgi:hypothetical protein
MQTLRFVVLAILLSACLPLARADDIPWGLNPALNDEFAFELGTFYAARTNTTAQLNSTTTGAGTSIDFQNLLGMSSSAWGPDGAFRWRMSEKWRLEASFFWIGQTGDKSIDRDIHWGDVTYPINAEVTSKMNFSDLRASVGYSFYKTSDKELGVGLGLHTLTYQFSLASLTQGTEGTRVLAPLPVLSVYGGFALNDQWSVSTRIDYFSLTYQQYHGGITSIALNALYQPFRHFGVGVGYQALFINFSADSTGVTSFEGKLNQSLQGPTFFLTASF